METDSPTGVRAAESPPVSPAVEKAATLAYKPFGWVFSIVGGLLANLVFGQVWKRVSDEPSPPDATDEDYTTREVLMAAVLQGALFALIKSAVDRGGMKLVKRLLR